MWLGKKTRLRGRILRVATVARADANPAKPLTRVEADTFPLGYFPEPHGIDSTIVAYYHGHKLMYVARTRNGFVPASRRQEFSTLKHLVTPTCPFVNLPEARLSRFGEELNAEKMTRQFG